METLALFLLCVIAGPVIVFAFFAQVVEDVE